jgi:hypothetical protein
MQKDERYKAVKRLIEKSDVREFREVFKYIPKTMVATDLGIAPERFSERLHQVEKFYLKDMFAMARLFNVEDIKVLHLASTQYEVVNGIIPGKTKGRPKKKYAAK